MNKKESNKRYLEEKKRLGFIYTSFFLKQDELVLLRKILVLDRNLCFVQMKKIVDLLEKKKHDEEQNKNIVSA